MMSALSAPRIQSRGQLLAVDLDSWQVVLASAGAASALGLPGQTLLGKPLLHLVGAELLDAWVPSLGWGGVSRVPQRFFAQRLSPACRSADVVIQAIETLLLIEILPRCRPLIGLDDTPALEQFAQRLRAAADGAARLRVLAEEMRILLQHRQCQVWHAGDGVRRPCRQWITPRAQSMGGCAEDLPACAPPSSGFQPGRSVQVRMHADLQCSGHALEGSRAAASMLGRRPLLAMPDAAESAWLAAQGARSAVWLEDWEGQLLRRVFVALSPEPLAPALDSLVSAERLLLVDTLVGRPGQTVG